MTVAAGLSVTVAAAFHECPALVDELRKVERHKKSAVKEIISAPRVAGGDELLLAVAGTVIICGNHGLILVKGHISVGVHSDDAVCDVESAVYSRKTRAVKAVCALRIAHWGACFAEPQLFAVLCRKLFCRRRGAACVMASHHVNSVHKFAVLVHSVGKAPGAYLFAAYHLYFRVIIGAVGLAFEM